MKRLNRFCKVEMIELADEKTPDKASDLENQQILEKEGNKILAKINEREFVIALAIEGKQFPSEKFSQLMMDTTVRGFSDITFVIGGSLGLSPAVKKTGKSSNEFWQINLTSSTDAPCFNRANLSSFYDSAGESLS